MCELLGMSANSPADISFSFSGLVQRSGNTGPHKDGWGITFYEGKGQRTFKDCKACCRSYVTELVKTHPIKSKIVISHIRQANRGGISLENTHPFVRTLYGYYWTFAHNGQLSDYESLETGYFVPVGQTDSEHAFCWLMNQVSQHFPECPGPKELCLFVAQCCDELRKLGVYNMLLTNGDYMMTYCSNNLHWITRRAPFGQASLVDEDLSIDFNKVNDPDDVISVIATKPLTDEPGWTKMAPGEFHLFKDGECILTNAKIASGCMEKVE